MEEKYSPYRLHKHDKRLTCRYCIVDGAVIGREGCTLLYTLLNVYMDDIAENLPNPLERRP